MGPHNLLDFIGQNKITESLAVLTTAARKRQEALDHLIFFGFPGLGKTTLSKIVANEMGVGMQVISGQVVEKATDFAATLTNLRAGDILLIQQIELLRRSLIELLIPAMEEYAIDIVIGKGSAARSVRLKLPHFTVIGITSNLFQVDKRLINLMLVYDFAPYDASELEKIILLLAKDEGIVIDPNSASLIANNCNGNSRQASMLLGKIQKYAIAYTAGQISQTVVSEALAVFNRNNTLSPKGRQPIPDDVKMFVWQRDNGRCVICGSQENLEYDHIIPISKGGSNTARNIQLLCEKHNRSKGGNLA